MKCNPCKPFARVIPKSGLASWLKFKHSRSIQGQLGRGSCLLRTYLYIYIYKGCIQNTRPSPMKRQIRSEYPTTPQPHSNYFCCSVWLTPESPISRHHPIWVRLQQLSCSRLRLANGRTRVSLGNPIRAKQPMAHKPKCGLNMAIHFNREPPRK